MVSDWAVGYETLPWTSRYPPDVVSRRQWDQDTGPYRSSVPAAIAGRPVTLPADVLAAADDASQDVARFDVDMGGEIAPYGVVLLRSESAASSQIENLTASAGRSPRRPSGTQPAQRGADRGEHAGDGTRRSRSPDRIDADAIREMHRTLLADTESDIAGSAPTSRCGSAARDSGRTGRVRAGPRTTRACRTRSRTSWRSSRADDVPVLAHAAVAHAQFETIHPSSTARRTGRARCTPCCGTGAHPATVDPSRPAARRHLGVFRGAGRLPRRGRGADRRAAGGGVRAGVPTGP